MQEQSIKFDLSRVQTRDRPRLIRRLKNAKSRDERAECESAIQTSSEITESRLAARHAFELAEDLPVTTRAREITEAINNHQVIIVSGETGSGKTTQLPKILMQAGYGARGLIGHTQPRRLAARSVAERIANEIGTPFGGLVGFKTRVDENLSGNTQIKLMTDGILLAETASDRFLNRYEVIIIDEAHERTLNVDFLLGYIKRLLPSRPDLKLVVTSATIDTTRFAEFFDDAPVIKIEGRSYPVEVRYRPLDNDTDQPEAIEAAAQELWREGPGDILVFLPGERDIRDAEQHLSRALARSRFSNAEVIPLYARLTRKAQQKIFTSSSGRRIVLSTNVAETSLTVPGIRYVVDTGLARISRYSTTSKVQRLPIEPVAQASCNQRAGRCGRIAPGICIRLFEQDDYENRAAFTDPEIRRTNLANVLLTMADLRLGEIEDFPFIDPPEGRYINDGRNLLLQLQAMKKQKGAHRITALGRKLARLPLDPRIGRMLLAGDNQGILPAMRVVAAGLTIQDPRERPAADRQAADEAQKVFTDKRSDFISLLRLWDAFAQAHKEYSGNQLRKWCRKHFLNFLRLREWEDLVRQLRRIGMQLQLSQAHSTDNLADTDYAALHQSLLTGLLDHVGRLNEEDSGSAKAKGNKKREYLGARGRHFYIFPGSALSNSSQRWIIAGELIETSRLFAHTVAGVEPEWIETAGSHLLKREHYEPAWSKRRGHVTVRERVKLYGLALAEGRKVDFGRIDPENARKIFITDGLVEFAVTDNRNRLPEFLAHNQAVVEEIAEQEARFRRRDLLVDEVTQAQFYDAQLPSQVYDRKSLLEYINAQGDAALRFTDDALLRNSGVTLPEEAFPKAITIGDATSRIPITLDYQFEPGSHEDGITLRIPLPALNQISTERTQWLVPGLLEEKICEYLKAMPKALRRNVVPVPDYARAIAERLEFGVGNLEDQIRESVRVMTGMRIPGNIWDDFTPSPHLQMGISIIDEQGKVLAKGHDLEQLQGEFSDQARAAVKSMPSNNIEQTGLTDWPQTDLPVNVTLEQAGVKIHATPALVDQGASVDLQLVDNAQQAERWHQLGVIRLLTLRIRQDTRRLKRELDDFSTLAALKLSEPPDTALPDRDLQEFIQRDDESRLLADFRLAILKSITQTVPRTSDEYKTLLAQAQAIMTQNAVELWPRLRHALVTYNSINKRLNRNVPLDWMNAVNDIRDQLSHLIYQGFISQMPDSSHLQRYLTALDQRLDKLKQAGTTQDSERMKLIDRWWHIYKEHAKRCSLRNERPKMLIEFRWMIEEYRVQIFAQPLGTALKVSPKRLQTLVDSLR